MNMSFLFLILCISSLVYPRCTHSTPSDPDSDCGSTGWAFTLFIAWNLLSMVRQTDNGDYCELTAFFSSIYSSTCLLVCHWVLRSCTSSDHALKGVVVESFSYVFQLVGGAKSITREEMRAFKKVWAEFANPRTGYLEKGQIVPFLGVSNLFYDICT